MLVIIYRVKDILIRNPPTEIHVCCSSELHNSIQGYIYQYSNGDSIVHDKYAVLIFVVQDHEMLQYYGFIYCIGCVHTIVWQSGRI